MKFIKRPSQIILYLRPGCPWCEDARTWLDEHALHYEVLNVGTEVEARKRAAEISSQTRVPVIEVDGLVLGDFDIGQLQSFLLQHGYLR